MTDSRKAPEVPNQKLPDVPADGASSPVTADLGERLRELPGWLPAAVAFALLLIIVDGRLLLGDVVYARDAARLHFPAKAYLVQRLASGEIPLWYPYEALGVPFIPGAVTAVFHPYTLLLLGFGAVRGLALSVLLSIALVFVGTRLLAKRLGLSEVGAVFAAVVASANGAFVSTFDNTTFLWGFSAFPWFLWGLHRAVARGCRGGAIASALALAWSVLAGDVQAAYLMGVVGLPFALVYGSTGPLRTTATVAGVGVLGAGLSAIQLIPSLSLLGELARGASVRWENASDWSMNPLRIPELFLGDLTGYVPRGDGAWQLLELGGRGPWHITVFGGSLTLPWLVTALGARGRNNRRTVWLLFLTAAALVWLALGRWGGLYRLSYDLLPLWSGFRYPEKLVPYAHLFLGLLAGMGLTAARAQPRRAAVLAWIVAGGTALVSVPAHLATPADPSVAAYLGALASGSLRATLLTGAFASILTFVAASRRRAWSLPVGFGAMLAIVLELGAVLALVLELGAVNGRILDLTGASAELLTLPNPVAKVVHERLRASGGRARVTSYDPTEFALGLDIPGEQTPTYLGITLWNRLALLPSYNAASDIEATTHYLPAMSLRHHELAAQHPTEWLLRDAAVFNGRYAVIDVETFAKLGLPADAVVADFGEFGLLLAENAAALPRAWVARPRFVDGSSEARAALREPEVRAGRVAVVEGRDGGVATSGAQTPAPATVVASAPERVELTAAGPGVLVLNDAWSPGWRARVDGAEVPVLRTNYLVRGVRLGPGIHRVVFEYPVPVSLWLGLFLTAVSALVVAWLGRSAIRAGG